MCLEVGEFVMASVGSPEPSGASRSLNYSEGVQVELREPQVAQGSPREPEGACSGAPFSLIVDFLIWNTFLTSIKTNGAE